MQIKNVVYAAALVIVTAGITTTVVSQENKNPIPGQQPPAMTPEMQEMMNKCMQAGAPGENHQLLAKRAGKWTATGKFWMIPDAPPMESTLTSEVKSIYDGRFIAESVEGAMPEGGTFLGQSWAGFDNVTKKFFWTWISNDCTSKMNATGTFDAATKTFTYTTTSSCPLAGKQVTGRTIEKWTDNDHFVMQMYGPWYKTGKEYKMMEITFARAK